jgi:hypothetical protein
MLEILLSTKSPAMTQENRSPSEPRKQMRRSQTAIRLDGQETCSQGSLVASASATTA